jgi:hypothetical protein
MTNDYTLTSRVNKYIKYQQYKQFFLISVYC